MNLHKISRAVRQALAAGSIAALALAGSAWAADDGGHTGSHSGGSGSHSGGPPAGKGPGAEHGEDHGDDHGDDHGSQGKGKGASGAPGSHSAGGHGETGHVPGGAGSGHSGGGRPVWAQEGIPEVELGRLNVSRAPAHVLARALAEAGDEYDAAMTAFYSQDAAAAAAQLAGDYQNVSRIDSPLQNLALYQALLGSGSSPLPGVTPASELDMAAIFLGSASDKTLPVSTDTVTAVNAILGLAPLSAQDTQTLATKAEAVRSGIATGHGE